MTTTRIPKNNCPGCGERLDAATSICEGTRPKPGDVTVCVECGEAMMFTRDLGIESIDPDTLPDAHPDDVRQIKRAQWAARNKEFLT